MNGPARYGDMNRGLKYLIYAVSFFLALGLSAYLTTFLIIKGEPEVEVPDLSGQGAVSALKTLSDIGLNLRVLAMDFSNTVPKDHIISQDPPAGTRIKQKRAVKVVLSKGSATVPLPDLRGLSLDQAASILEQSHLKKGLVSYTYGLEPDQGRNRIISQSPEPMVPVHPGSEVNFLVSLGPRPVLLVMPDLTGQPYTLALFYLERSGLTLGRLETEVRPGWPVETVVLQDPGPGGPVAEGALVRLTVSRDEDLELSEYRLQLIEYDVPLGLLRRQIRIRAAVGDYLLDVHDKWHEPGERVRVLALVRGLSRVQIFDDGEEKSPLFQENIYRGFQDDEDSSFDTIGGFFKIGR